jgi:hypothetical protein
MEPGNDIVEFVWSKGIGDAVLEVIRLEGNRASDGCPKDSIVVDLAVVESEMDRVIPHFVLVELPLSNVSMISLVPDSKVVERQTILRHYAVHARYMQQYVQRETEGQLLPLVASWYKKKKLYWFFNFVYKAYNIFNLFKLFFMQERGFSTSTINLDVNGVEQVQSNVFTFKLNYIYI